MVSAMDDYTRLPDVSTEQDSERGETTGKAGAAPHGSTYVDLTRLVERLHRRFLDVLREQLTRLGVNDLNAVQCLLLCNIGGEEVNNRHLMERGYYQGSNASYNIKKLVETGYLEQRQAEHDRRSTLLKLSAKGRELAAKVAAADNALASRLPANAVQTANQTLRQIERVWDDFVNRRD
jgi:DNA-binding MarR family transcriptional regulator